MIKSKYSFPFLIFILLVCFSCQAPLNKPSLLEAEWIIGTWKGVSHNNTFYERWSRQGDTLFVNTNYHLENGDTIIGGQSRIVWRKGVVYYFNGKDGHSEVSWRATEFTPTSMTFKNGAVKTYQTILFKLTSDNKWQAQLVTPGDTVRYSLERIN